MTLDLLSLWLNNVWIADTSILDVGYTVIPPIFPIPSEHEIIDRMNKTDNAIDVRFW